MAKKTRADSGPAPQDSKGRRKTLWVIDENGQRQRFLRGAVTYHLTQRGFDFDDAYAVARSLRDRLAHREQVTTDEIWDLVQEQIETTFGAEAVQSLTSRQSANPPSLVVTSGGKQQPFSRGLLARSVHAASIHFDRAYRLVTELEGELQREQVSELSRHELALRVGDLLERLEGKGAARRYRLVRRLQRLPKPLVVYVGGASGTGKSTLALELAPLLKIYRVTATDTIRQVMRSLISPQILPAIHGSSFEAPHHLWTLPQDRDSLSDAEQRVVDSFLEQAVRIGVGVRAVVERAIAENTSALVEGVHLLPPVVPFKDLEGACYQVPLMLGISEIEEHRSRFLGRAPSRRGERYIEQFQAIRNLHDFIIDQAESEEIAFLDTSLRDAAPRALRLVAAMLQEKVPALDEDDAKRQAPTLLLALDGVGDVATKALGDRTPLNAATTPTLDRLATGGACGLADPLAPGVVPDTAAGTLALLGQSPSAMRRGPVEALGAGLPIRLDDIALRANFATLENGTIIDRRAGRIRDESEQLAEAIDGLRLPDPSLGGMTVRVAAATEHRLAILLRGEGLSSALRGSDPGEASLPSPPLTPEPNDPTDEAAVLTARVLALFEQTARKVLTKHPVNRDRVARGLLPANAVLTRGAGRLHRLQAVGQQGFPLRLTCVAGDQTVRGLAAWLGADIVEDEAMTANLDTDLGRKFELAGQALTRSDLVILHVKGADIAAHDRKPGQKAAFIEAMDAELGRMLEGFPGPLRIAVASDHATSSESGHHTADPVPILIWGPGIDADEVQRFDESAVASGALERFPLQLLLGRLFDLA